MVEEMKFEDSSLTGYLVRNLKSLTEADPVILSEYVVALLKKDKSTKELQKLCTDSLVEFLGHNTKSFTTKLFQALEDGSIVRAERNLDVVKNSELPHPAIAVETHQQKSQPKEKSHSSSSEPTSDPEDKEVSDDDDRNHKHRRREPQLHSLDNDVQDQSIRRPNRKRNKPYDNGQVFLEPDPQTSGSDNLTHERNTFLRLDKQHSISGPLLRAPIEFGPRARLAQSFRSDSGARFDLSTSVGHPPIGRGRGRSSVSWSQHDLRFNPLDTLDYASRMASKGPGHPVLLGGNGLPGGASAQNTSWGGFGFIGMSNGILDPLHPLGLQGTVRPTITPPLNLGVPRQRCRDFEERGFCLRGDMCPMEHGLNRIVVEDVQSLSQFNLPVSIPSSHSLGIQAASGPSTTVPAPSSLLTNSKAIPSKNGKSEVVDDAIKLNGVSPTSGGDDADVYDPDQPLWNTDHQNTSTDLLMLPSSNIGDEALWDADASACKYGLSDGTQSHVPGRSAIANMGPKPKTSSVWGRIGSRFKSESGSRSNHNMTSTGCHENDMKEDQEEAIANFASNISNHAPSVESGSKATAIRSGHRSFADPAQRSGRPLSKASRTLFVYGIPQTDNRRGAIFSHFKKFGKVVHIHIPLNSEKAFVQFNKREEAEAALKSSDAVMGNRFIKLAWANRDRNPDEMHNRDRLPDEIQSSAPTEFVCPPSSVVTSVSSQQLVAGGGKETLPFSAQKRSNPASTSTAETPVSVSGHPRTLTNVMGFVSGHPKVLPSNVPIAAPPVLKKVESLELLQEIRKKQELLDKKRDEFRRQLDKFEKQAISVKKGDVLSEQAVKRHKTEVGNEATKAATPRNSYSSQICQDGEKTLEKKYSQGVHVSPSLKGNSTTLQKSRKSINQPSSMPPPLLNRFKLDNRSTSFRILPPLPDDFANVDILKGHFSSFGVISSVVLEKAEAHTEDAGLKPSDKCSACISFDTRLAAERAYQSGKSWEGHNLQFMWLTVTPNSSSECTAQETSTLKEDQNAELQADPVMSVSNPLSTVNPTCGPMSQLASVRNKESNMNLESTNCVSEPTSGLISEGAAVRTEESNMDVESTNEVADICPLVPPLPSSPVSATMPLSKECPEKSKECPEKGDAPIIEGSINVAL